MYFVPAAGTVAGVCLIFSVTSDRTTAQSAFEVCIFYFYLCQKLYKICVGGMLQN